VTEADLRAAFEVFGTVAEVRILTDRESGQPRGFGFAEMPSATEAQAALREVWGRQRG
jgi:RNA recognition motif-containing protein